jgi:hypothetical protein
MAKPSGILTTLWIISRLLARRFRLLPATTDQQRAVPPELPLDDLPAGIPCYSVSVQAGQGEWTGTGMQVKVGDEFTVFAHGQVTLSRLLDLKIGATVGLWYRIGNGPVLKFPLNCATVRATTMGEVRLALKPPGEWALPDGTFDSRYSRQAGSGGFSVRLVLWQAGSATQGLKDWWTRSEHHGALQEAFDLLNAPPTLPQDWEYLWRLGEGHIYQEVRGNPSSIHCHTQEDVGILQYPVDVPLTENLWFAWQWKIDCLPSRIREDSQPTHDYLSIAVEFDNGLDLTYLWSAELPEGKIFQCPLPWWSERETHWVVRSGERQLGQWLPERRQLLEDYRAAIGGEEPGRVVSVWLIAVSVFQRGKGVCDYRAIELDTGVEPALIIGPGAGKL